MRPLSPDELSEIRLKLAGSSTPSEKLDELIRILDAVAVSFIDQRFGFSAVQLSLSAHASRAFSGEDSCGRVQLSGKHDGEYAKYNGADSTNNRIRDFTP